MRPVLLLIGFMLFANLVFSQGIQGPGGIKDAAIWFATDTDSSHTYLKSKLNRKDSIAITSFSFSSDFVE